MSHSFLSLSSRWLYWSLLAYFITSFGLTHSSASPWSKTNNQHQLMLDLEYLKSSLTPSSLRSKNKNKASLGIELPLPDGKSIQVELTPSTLLPTSLAQRYPNINTWTINHNKYAITGSVDITEQGFHAMLIMPNGKVISINPTDKTARYYRSEYQQPHTHSRSLCLTKHSDNQNLPISTLKAKLPQKKDQLVTYRIAIAATYPYTHYHGNKTKALSAIVTTINRLNTIYQRDLGIRFVLVENNDQIIFDDPNEDPFLFALNWPTAMLIQNKETLDQIIGEENYDIGHVFSQGMDGGIASAYSACTDEKASGYTSSPKPDGDLFNVDFVAHEIGHQLGAEHSFNSETGSCGGGNRVQQFSVEPGSGSTIMGYAGLCGINDIQVETDATFHITSINMIKKFIMKDAGKNCGTRKTMDNYRPEITPSVKKYYIPIQTPFTLTTHATDPDSNQTLTYSWDQVDIGSASDATVDMGNNAILRNLPPSTNNSREFPSVAAQQARFPIAGEIIPVGERDIHFKYVVRDGHSGIASQDITIHAIDSEPGKLFAITSHSTLKKNTTIEVQWNTANTNKKPINCHTVNLDLSTDSGKSFPYSLAKNIANTGSAYVLLPDLVFNQQSRLKISCHQGIFFSVTRSSKPVDTDGNAAINTVPNYLTNSKPDKKESVAALSPFILIALLSIAYYRKRVKLKLL